MKNPHRIAHRWWTYCSNLGKKVTIFWRCVHHLFRKNMRDFGRIQLLMECRLNKHGEHWKQQQNIVVGRDFIYIQKSRYIDYSNIRDTHGYVIFKRWYIFLHFVAQSLNWTSLNKIIIHEFVIFTMIHKIKLTRNWYWSFSSSSSPTVFSTITYNELPSVLWIRSNFFLYARFTFFVVYFSRLPHIQTRILIICSPHDPITRRTKKTIPVLSVNIHCWLKCVVWENKSVYFILDGRHI